MLDEILTFLQSAIATDWIIICLMIVFAILGFIRGGAKILIHSLWSITGIIIATLFYQDITNLNLLIFTNINEQGLLFINFLLIFFLFISLKFGIYKLLKIIANIHGPCPLNRFIAMLIGLFFAVVLSWYITMDVSNFDIVYSLITNDFMRFFSSFIVVFTFMMILVFTFTKLLHVRVGIDKPCPLLVALQPLDGILNAKNINSVWNNLEGIVFSILQGLIILILLIIINNHFELFTLNTSNIESITYYLQEFSLETQSVLSNYLSFINKT